MVPRRRARGGGCSRAAPRWLRQAQPPPPHPRSLSLPKGPGAHAYRWLRQAQPPPPHPTSLSSKTERKCTVPELVEGTGSRDAVRRRARRDGTVDVQGDETRGAQCHLQIDGRRLVGGEEGEGRTRSRDQSRQRARTLAAFEDPRQIGPQVQRRGLQVVAQGRGEHLGIPLTQRVQHVGVDRGNTPSGTDVDRVALAVGVEFAVDDGCRHPDLVGHQHPVEASAGERRAQLVTATGAHGGAAEQGEGHVGAEVGRQAGELARRHPETPQGVARDEGGRRIGGAAAHSAGDGHGLSDREVRAAIDTGRASEELRRSDREVALVGGHALDVDRALRGDRHRDVVGRGGHHLLVERDGLERRRELVVAVVLHVADLEEDVDFPGGAHAHGCGGGAVHRCPFPAARRTVSGCAKLERRPASRRRSHSGSGQTGPERAMRVTLRQ